jgi:hypothetical protein
MVQAAEEKAPPPPLLLVPMDEISCPHFHESIFSIRAKLTYTVIRFFSASAKFGTCTVENINGTLVEDKMRAFKGKCAHFSLNKGPFYTDESASAKFTVAPN